MSHKFVFAVLVEVEHEQGQFVSRAALAEKISESLVSAQDENFRYGVSLRNDSGELSDYKIAKWDVGEVRSRRNR